MADDYKIETISEVSTDPPVKTLHPQDSSYDYLIDPLHVEVSPMPDDWNTRTRQQGVIPSAIKSRLMQPVQDDSGIALTSSALVPDGASVIGSVTTTSTNGGMILCVVYFQVFIDNLLSSQTMPQNISSKLYPFYVWNSLYDNNGVSLTTQPGKSVTKIQVRNAVGDGSSHRIFIQAYPRMIINGSGQTSS